MNHRKFKYKIVEIDLNDESYWDNENYEWRHLDLLGEYGWEMVSVVWNHDNWQAVFKREIIAPHPKQ